MSVRQSGYSFRGSLALLLSAKKEENFKGNLKKKVPLILVGKNLPM
jgi:hypothetical protein